MGDDITIAFTHKLIRKVGFQEAVILSQIHYWVQKNKRDGRNFHDGRYWTFNSFEKWHEQFFWWDIRTLKRYFSKLKNAGYIIVGNYNKYRRDRTKWYTLNYELLPELQDEPSKEPESEEMTKCKNVTMLQSDKMPLPLPENTYTREYQDMRASKNFSPPMCMNASVYTCSGNENFEGDNADKGKVSREITVSYLIDRFGAKPTSDAFKLLHEYIKYIYPEARGRSHKPVDERHMNKYAYNVLVCSAIIRNRGLDTVMAILEHAAYEEKKYDPTIDHVSAPKALGLWGINAGFLLHSDIENNCMNYKVDTEKETDCSEKLVKELRDDYVPLSGLTETEDEWDESAIPF